MVEVTGLDIDDPCLANRISAMLIALQGFTFTLSNTLKKMVEVTGLEPVTLAL